MAARTLPEVGRCFGERGDRPDADVLGVEELQPLGERAGAKIAASSAASVSCRRRTGARPARAGRTARSGGGRRRARARRPSGGGRPQSRRCGNRRARRSASAGRSRRRAGARRGGGSRASSRRRRGFPCRCALVRAAPRGSSPPRRARPPRSRRSGRRQRRCGVPEHAGPAEVVEVVPGTLLVAAAEAEAGDRAVDGALRHVLGADPEPRRDAGRNDSSTTSASRTSSSAGAGSRFRSTSSDSFPARSAASQAGALLRIGSPPGGSMQTTRAPSSSSSREAKAPGRYRLKSTTSIPLSGCIRRRT